MVLLINLKIKYLTFTLLILQNNVPIEFVIQVLTSGNRIWPFSSSALNISLPAGLGDKFEAFHCYYSKEYSNGSKCLTLQPALGSALIDAIFYGSSNDGFDAKKNYLLTVSTYQMCVLMLFNDRERLISYQVSFIIALNCTRSKENYFLLNLGYFGCYKHSKAGAGLCPSFTFARYTVSSGSYKGTEKRRA